MNANNVEQVTKFTAEVPLKVHEKICRYQALRRIEGARLTIPQAATELINLGLESKEVKAKLHKEPAAQL